MYPLWLAFTFLLEKPKPNRDFVTKNKKSIKRPSSKSCDNILTLLIALTREPIRIKMRTEKKNVIKPF